MITANMNIFSFNKGYTLLFSVIVASVVLSISAFILSTARKQFIIASAAHDSMIAVYAADSGIQCALSAYFDNILATSTFNPAKAFIPCNLITTTGVSNYEELPIGQNDRIDAAMQLENDAEYRVWQTIEPIQFNFDSSKSCVRITVTVGFDKTSKKHKTVIDSRGYNDVDSFPCFDPILDDDDRYNPRAVERAVRLIYLD
jgi:hypothetical protein